MSNEVRDYMRELGQLKLATNRELDNVQDGLAFGAKDFVDMMTKVLVRLGYKVDKS